MANEPKVQAFGFEVERKGHYEEAGLVAVVQEIDFNLFPEIHGFHGQWPVPVPVFGKTSKSVIVTTSAALFGFTSPSIHTKTVFKAPKIQAVGFEVEKKGHYEDAEFVAIVQEVDFNLFPEVLGIGFGLPLVEKFGPTSSSICSRTAIPQLRGIEIDVAKDAELAGIEIAASLQEDLVHPKWTGTRGINSVVTETNFAITVELKSTVITDEYNIAMFELFIAQGNLSAEQLFVDIYSLGAFRFGDHYITVLPDGSSPLPATQYTLGVRAIDQSTNAEVTSEVSLVTTSTGILLDAPVFQAVDDGTGTSITIELLVRTTDVSYDHVEIYRLQGYTTTNAGYKQLVTNFTNVGETYQITGLEIAEEVRLIAVAVDVNLVKGYWSRISSIVMSDPTIPDEFVETPVSTQLPTITGDSVGTGVQYPFEISDGVLQTSSGFDRLYESIILILRTITTTRLMHPEFGLGSNWLTFESLGSYLETVLNEITKESVEKNESRVTVESVSITNIDRNNRTVTVLINCRSTGSNETGTITYTFQLS